VSDTDLKSQRILVIEDEHLVARSICRLFRSWGADVVGPAGTVDEALAVLRATEGITGAMLDINLRGVRAYAVADELVARGIRFVFATGYGEPIIPDRYRQVPILLKPFGSEEIVRALFSDR
jgi:CheY-like chemotaxis protein